jgi:hypothetical protein
LSLTRAYVVKGAAGDHRNDNDYYPTPAIGTRSLLRNCHVPDHLWEPAAGRGHMSAELIRNGHEVVSSDLYEYPNPLVEIATGVDFLKQEVRLGDGVVTNPPFKNNLPEKLLRHCLEDLGYRFVAFFCRLTFMESLRRYDLFKDHPPRRVMVLSGRVNCHEMYFDQNDGLGGMVAYAWFVWDTRLPDSTLLPTELTWIRPSDYVER